MQKKNLVVRGAVYVWGLFIMTIGIAVSVKSNLGVSPVSSIPYTMTCVWGIEMGKATIFFHIGLVIIQVILLRKNFKVKNLLQIPVGIIFGYLTTLSNFAMDILPEPTSIAVRLLMIVISAFLIALGIFLYVPADIVPLAGEGAMLAVSQITKKPFSTIKICFDVSMVAISLVVCLALIHSLGSVGIGTVVAAFLVGIMLKLITKQFGALRDRIFSFNAEEEKLEVSELAPLLSIMKKDVYTINGNDEIIDALKLISSKKVSGVPVVDDDGALIGFISDGDIISFLAKENPLYVNTYSLFSLNFDDQLKDLMERKVKDIAKKKVITVDAGSDLRDVCYTLADNHIKKAPVMQNGKMIGIINNSNIIKYALARGLESRY